MTEYALLPEQRKIYFEVTGTSFIFANSVRFDKTEHAHNLETIAVMTQVRKLGTLLKGNYVAERNSSAEWRITPLPKPSSPSH